MYLRVEFASCFVAQLCAILVKKCRWHDHDDTDDDDDDDDDEEEEEEEEEDYDDGNNLSAFTSSSWFRHWNTEILLSSEFRYFVTYIQQYAFVIINIIIIIIIIVVIRSIENQ